MCDYEGTERSFLLQKTSLKISRIFDWDPRPDPRLRSRTVPTPESLWTLDIHVNELYRWAVNQ